MASPTVIPVGEPDLLRNGGSQDRERIDSHGNPIDDAMGDYWFDSRGERTERHSSPLESTRLGPPTT